MSARWIKGYGRWIALILTGLAGPGIIAQGPSFATGFERFPLGPLTKVDSPVGLWTATPGQAAVHGAHAAAGTRCLHLRGGTDRTVHLQLPQHSVGFGALSFVAERWTRRAPFKLRLECRTEGRWIEIYRGDQSLPVGGFSAPQCVPLPATALIKELRFRCTSPIGSGVLLDAITLYPASAQSVHSVQAIQRTLPVLRGVPKSPTDSVRIEVTGTQGPLTLSHVEVQLGASATLCSAVHVFSTGSREDLRAWRNPDCLAEGLRFGESQPPAERLAFTGELHLQPGPNVLWAAVTLKPDASIDATLSVEISSLTLSDGSRLAVRREQAAQERKRLGIALRTQGADGIDTSRIPGLARTAKGTLLAVYDLRHHSAGDLPGAIDVGLSRSTDGGQTWEPFRTIMDMGDDPQWHHDGIGDPAILVDRKTDTIWVSAVWSHGDRGWHGSGPGLSPTETGQWMLVKSEDDGRTWSPPLNITTQVKQPEWSFLLQGPGKGITMRDGTLVFPAQYQEGPNSRRPHSTIIYSLDRGITWSIGSGVHDDTTEAQVVEISPGTLMINCRSNRSGYRVIKTTTNLGRTWTTHPSSESTLIEPRACMASLISIRGELGDGAPDWLLFSNPNSSERRERMTIKASSDQGATWPRAQELLLDDGVGAGYSCLTMIDADTVGILYEGSLAHLVFQRIPLQDLIRR